MTPFLSVIMPSYLGEYPGAASHRHTKLRRAVESVIGQSFQNWELVIIADGCDKTMAIAADYVGDPRIKCTLIEKCPLWSTGPRNAGVHHATGQHLCYLDADDYFGPDHLKNIAIGIDPAAPFGYFDGLLWSVRKNAFVQRRCDLSKRFQFGTSNFVHRPDTYWPMPTDRSGRKQPAYYQDAHFGEMLIALGDGTRIEGAQYFVCHVPMGKDKCDV